MFVFVRDKRREGIRNLEGKIRNVKCKGREGKKEGRWEERER